MNIPQQESGRNQPTWKLTLMLILGFIIGFAGSWVWFSKPDLFNLTDSVDDVVEQKDDVKVVDDVKTITPVVTPAVSATEDFVNVKDQSAGNGVFLSLVSLTKNGWVAVRDINEDGSTGNILGATRFDAGETQGRTVELLRATEAGKKYRVVLFFGDGDGVFDYKKDALVVDSDGSERGYDFEVYAAQ